MAVNVQFLIQVGRHPPDHVMNYSLKQVAAFTELARNQHSMQQVELASAVRVGMHANQEQYAKHVSSLLKHLTG